MDGKLSIGIDLVEIERIRRSVCKNASFLMRFFGEEERKLFETPHPMERIAAHFAAKEAFAKAMRTGLTGFALREVQLLRRPDGSPYFVLSGRAAALAEGYDLQVSISHTGNMAVAMVAACKKEDAPC